MGENNEIGLPRPGDEVGTGFGTRRANGLGMSVRVLHLPFILLMSGLLLLPAFSQDRPGNVALLIGNANYQESSAALPTTIGDARALADEFRRQNFDVDIKENLGADAMLRAVDAFLGKISSGSTALFYFGGYGVQAGRQTFLLPVDAQGSTEAAVRREGINLDATVAEIHRRGARIKVVIIDAARRNPYEARFRTTPIGLAPLDTPTGTLALYAAAPGKLSPDGKGTTSVLVTELLREMRVPGRQAEEVFNRARIAVARTSNNEHVPWVATALTEPYQLGQLPPRPAAPPPPVVAAAPPPAAITLRPAPPSPSVAPAPPPVAAPPPAPVAPPPPVAAPAPEPKPAPRPDPEEAARSDYLFAETVGTRKAWDDFLARHPSGRYADAARDKVAALAPPPPVAAPAPEPKPAPRPDPEEAARSDYLFAETVGTRKAWDDFLARHPSGRYADAARDQVATLKPPAPEPKPAPEPSRPQISVAPMPATQPEPAPMVEGSDDPAIVELDGRIKQSPNDAVAYYKRGQLYAQHGSFRRAIEDFDAVLRLNPRDAEALNNRCWSRAVVGDLQAAKSDCDEAMKIRPRYLDAYDSRGFINLKLGKPRDAIKDYDAALQINARHASALYGRGLAKLKIGDATGGNNDVAAAKRIQPDIVDEFATYGLR